MTKHLKAKSNLRWNQWMPCWMPLVGMYVEEPSDLVLPAVLQVSPGRRRGRIHGGREGGRKVGKEVGREGAEREGGGEGGGEEGGEGERPLELTPEPYTLR